MRRIFGFSIISSVGMLILGLAIHTPLAIAAALFYLFQDVLVKVNLFMSAGAVRRLAGSEAFAEAGGVWRAAPWASLLFLIPALSLAGVPPFPGFWAKLLLLQASLGADRLVATGTLGTRVSRAEADTEALARTHHRGPEPPHVRHLLGPTAARPA
jgi:multicomponent Na+:H+ antiporter subunit D